MSKQQLMANIESVQDWAWIQAPGSMAVSAIEAANLPASNSTDPVEDPIEPWRRIQERLDPLLSTPEQLGDFPARMEALALDIQRMIESDPDLAILAMLRLDSFDYTVAHALQTAVVCDIYAHAVGKSREQRVELIQAALTMNIAMLELQRELEWQSAPPSPEQRRQIYEHPQRGRERLQALGVRNETWLRAVSEHHESPDGSGYPTGCLSASSEADILAVVDRYCAMLSRRGLRDPMVSNRAAQSLYCAAQGSRQSLAIQIVDIFGQHPPGSLVRLVNGEIGIVIRRGDTLQCEQVCALASANGGILQKPVLRDTTEPVHVIVGSASDRDFKGTIDYIALRRMMG
jgi:hypothetical protein